MNQMQIVVTTVLTTLAVLTMIGVFAASTFWPEAALAHGLMRHGGPSADGNHCTRLDAKHTRHIRALISAELDLDDAQDVALEPVIDVLERWRLDAVETCNGVDTTSLDDGLAAFQAVLDRSGQAIAELRPAVDAFYTQLSAEQQVDLDAWIDHHH